MKSVKCSDKIRENTTTTKIYPQNINWEKNLCERKNYQEIIKRI